VEDLDRFSIEAPRYTSYPTAVEFGSAVGPDEHASFLRHAAAEPRARGLSLYVHLPFCQTICHFCGCHALTARTEGRMERYLSALEQEMALVARQLGSSRRVSELHFGGGSPSFLPAASFRDVMRELRGHFAFDDDAALSLEADPRTTDEEKLATYREAGIGRISFGFQDLDDNVQNAIGRHQSAEVSRTVYWAARKAGFEGINVDLCYGLPRQTLETFARTIDEVLELRPDRVAVFGYAHVPWAKPKQRLIVVDELPPPEVRFALVVLARERFLAAGYRAIGFDHFALPEDDLALAAEGGKLHRNFQGYTTAGTDALVGLGLSAISELPAGYVQNARTLRDYHLAVEAGRLPTERGVARSADDQLRWGVIREILCAFRLDVPELERRTGLTFREAFAPELAELRRLETTGLLAFAGPSLELTPLGRLFARNVAMVFDAYRRRAPNGGAPRFSRSI